MTDRKPEHLAGLWRYRQAQYLAEDLKLSGDATRVLTELWCMAGSKRAEESPIDLDWIMGACHLSRCRAREAVIECSATCQRAGVLVDVSRPIGLSRWRGLKFRVREYEPHSTQLLTIYWKGPPLTERGLFLQKRKASHAG